MSFRLWQHITCTFSGFCWSPSFSAILQLFGMALVMAAVVSPAFGQAQYVHSSTLTAPDAHEGAEFGASVDEVGDIDGDGTSDVLVGAPTDSVEGSNPGRAFLFSGVDGHHLRTLIAPTPEDLALFGGAAAGVGDVNGDGTPDIVVSAEGEAIEDKNSAGRVYVFSGADGQVLHALASPAPESYGHFGSAVAGIGDVNSDGTPDVLVGARGETVDGADRAGRVYVMSGVDGRVLDTIESGAADGLGKTLSIVGDGNGEEPLDLFAGANLATVQDHERAGRVYRIGGSELDVQQSIASPNPEESGHFGRVVAALEEGDPHLIVGTGLETVNGHEKAGRVYLFDRAEERLLHTIEAPTPEADARFGISVVGIDSASGREPVVMVGERPPIQERAVTENTGPGQVYVFDGADGQLLQTISSPNAEARGGFGATLSQFEPSEGEVTVAVGAVAESVDGTEKVGRVYLYTPAGD